MKNEIQEILKQADRIKAIREELVKELAACPDFIDHSEPGEEFADEEDEVNDELEGR